MKINLLLLCPLATIPFLPFFFLSISLHIKKYFYSNHRLSSWGSNYELHLEWDACLSVTPSWSNAILATGPQLQVLDTPKPHEVEEEEEGEERSLWPTGAPCIRILGRRCILLRRLLARSQSYLHEVETTERVQAVAASRSVHTCICVHRVHGRLQFNVDT